MARLRKLQCSDASGLNCSWRIEAGIGQGSSKSRFSRSEVPSGHIVTIFHAIVDPPLSFVDVLFPGFLASP